MDIIKVLIVRSSFDGARCERLSHQKAVQQ